MGRRSSRNIVRCKAPGVFPPRRGRPRTVLSYQRLEPKTLVWTAALLLLLFWSPVSDAAEASLVIVVFPRAVTFTTSVTVNVSPEPSRAASQVTVPAVPAGGAVRLPWLQLALTNVEPRGSGSGMTRLKAGPWPKVLKRMVYVRASLFLTGSGVGLMLTRRSAERSLAGSGHVARKSSSLPSALPPVRSEVELKAMRPPSPLIEGAELWPAAESVIWVSLAVAGSYTKISSLPSALPPVRSHVELKAMRSPSPLIEGDWLKPAVALVI